MVEILGKMNKKHYHEIDGELLARVTSITGQLAKPPLVPWAAKCAVDYIFNYLKSDVYEIETFKQTLQDARTEYKRQSDEAKEIGEIVHSTIHDKLVIVDSDSILYLTKMMFSSKEIGNCYNAFRDWHNKFNSRPMVLEQIVHNKRRKRAGRFDFFGYIKAPEWRKHRLYLIDWKTSKSLYFEDLIQIALYFYDYQLLTGTKIDGAANLRLDKNTGKYQWKPYPRYKLRNAYRIGNHLTAIWYLRHGK